ncbi:MAG: proteasome assembly chaperone family protein [Sciscionella sp.]
MWDQENLYEVASDVPELGGAVLLHYFDGFMDAGSAGRVFTEHLLDELEHRVVARFDVDRLIDYRARRPALTYATDHWEHYDAPELVVYLLHDTTGTPFLLLTGPEPDREWERFTAAVRSLVERWGVRLTVGFHGIPVGAPHTRSLGMTAHATRAELVADYDSMLNRMQVPGSVAALLELRLGEGGHDAMGFAAHVPHYLAQATFQSSAVTLLESITRSTGLGLPEHSLRSAASSAAAELDRQVAESEEATDVVRALEQQYDTFAGANRQHSLLDSTEQLPSADEIGNELERFLAEHQERTDPPEH